MNESGSWHIFPAYDLTFTTNMSGTAYENRHSLSLLGKNENISIEDLVRFAKENGVKNVKSILSEVGLAIRHFHRLALQNDITSYWTDKIEQCLSQLVPEDRVIDMQHLMPTQADVFITTDGVRISCIQLTETARHDFLLKASIGGKPYRHL
jgi:serine/threonine-protein kinase HipA